MSIQDSTFSSKDEPLFQRGAPVNPFNHPVEYARAALESESFKNLEVPLATENITKPAPLEEEKKPVSPSGEISVPPMAEEKSLEVDTGRQMATPDQNLPVATIDGSASAGKDIQPLPETPELDSQVTMPRQDQEVRQQITHPPIEPERRLTVKAESQPTEQNMEVNFVRPASFRPWEAASDLQPEWQKNLDGLAREIGEQVRPDLEDMRQSLVYKAKEAIFRESVYQRYGEL